MIFLKDIKITANPKLLAHCRMCRDPMYCIYDWTLRDYCWECLCEMQEGDSGDDVKLDSTVY